MAAKNGGRSRAGELRSALGPSCAGNADALVLLDEACRAADRLDKLDALLSGDADVWCRLTHRLQTEDYELKIDSALSEARQQASALRLLLESIRKLTVRKAGEASEDDVEEDDVVVRFTGRAKGRGAGGAAPASAARRSQPRKSNGSHRVHGGSGPAS